MKRYLFLIIPIILFLLTFCTVSKRVDIDLRVETYIRTYADFELDPDEAVEITYIDQNSVEVLVVVAYSEEPDYLNVKLKVGSDLIGYYERTQEENREKFFFKKDSGSNWIVDQDSLKVVVDYAVEGKMYEDIFEYEYRLYPVPKLKLLKPEDGETVSSNPIFEWEWEVPEKLKDKIEYYKLYYLLENLEWKTSSIELISHSGKNFKGTAGIDFEGNMMYYWYVVAVVETVGGTQEIGSDKAYKFWIENHMPNDPIPLEPVGEVDHEGIFSNGGIVFKFKLSDPDSYSNFVNGLRYILEYRKSGGDWNRFESSTRFSGDSTVVEVKSDIPLEVAKYEWRVTVIDHDRPRNVDVSRVSETVSFEISNSTPSVDDLSPEGEVYVDPSLGKVDLRWSGSDPDGDPLVYEVRFGTNSDPLRNNPIVRFEDSFSEEGTTVSVEIGKTYYLAVRAKDPFGSISPWSTSTFVVLSDEIFIPEKLFPPDGWVFNIDHGEEYLPEATFSWRDVEALEDPIYVFELNFPDGSEEIFTTDATFYTMENLPDGDYTWNVHVQGYRSGGGFDFTVNRRPSKPECIYPENGSEDVPLDVTLSWSESRDEDGDIVFYDVYLSNSREDVESMKGDALVSYYQSGTELSLSLDDDTTYYWRVVARDRKGKTPGEICYFKTIDVNSPPKTPYSPSPSSGSRNIPVENLELEWSSGDPDGDTLEFFIYLSKDKSCVESGSKECLVGDFHDSGNKVRYSYTLQMKLDYGTLYHWKVVVYDGKFKVQGPVWDFVTGPRPNTPPSVALYYPNDGQQDLELPLRLEWKVEDPDFNVWKYRVYISNFPENVRYEDPMALYGEYEYWELPHEGDPRGNARVYLYIMNLESDTVYYWKIVAVDDEGAEGRSEIWSFKTR